MQTDPTSASSRTSSAVTTVGPEPRNGTFCEIVTIRSDFKREWMQQNGMDHHEGYADRSLSTHVDNRPVLHVGNGTP